MFLILGKDIEGHGFQGDDKDVKSVSFEDVEANKEEIIESNFGYRVDFGCWVFLMISLIMIM